MLTRREFIKLVMTTAAAGGLADALIPRLAEAFIDKKKPVAIWLEMMTCTGDFLSIANTLHPGMRELLFETVDLRFSNTSMAAEGDLAIDTLLKTAEEAKGEFILIAEGTVPTGAGGRYGLIGHHKDGRPFTDLEAIKLIAPKAKYIMSIGTCAAFGGPFAARPNPSGSRAVYQVVDRQVVNVPGCPVHPDWAVGTLTHLLLYGIPDLDAYGRPTLFFGRRIHDWCPRRNHFDNGYFAEHPGDEKCTYKIGCKGPVTYSDCPTREWNSEHTNWPVEANTPCIGCVNPDFPDASMPFYEHLPSVPTAAFGTTVTKFGVGVGALTAAGIGTHLAVNIATGRLGKHLVDGTKPVGTGALDDIRDKKFKDGEVVFTPGQRLQEISLKEYRVRVKPGQKNILSKLKAKRKTGLTAVIDRLKNITGRNPLKKFRKR